jgi:SAM-dependent methyltransferase
LKKNDLDGHTGYRSDFKFHEENLQMLGWYAERFVMALGRAGARSLLSLGVGHQVVVRRILDQMGKGLESYTVVEGSSARIAELAASSVLPEGVRLVESFFETYVAPEPIDAIEMGFVLEHVDDPLEILTRYAAFLRPGGLLVVVVPNARSLHRLVGHEAGFLDDVYRLSPQDLELGHQRYFDLASIRELVERAGLRILRTEGVFLKCVTTAQLEALRLSAEVLRGFFQVGIAFPEICNAVYLETTR